MKHREIIGNRKVMGRLLSRGDDDEARDLVLCLPGDGPSKWNGPTWSAFAQRLTGRGLRVLIPQYPAYTVGDRSVVPLSEAVALCTEVLARLGAFVDVRPVVTIASSFGAAIVLARPDLTDGAKAIVLKSPAADLISAYYRELGGSELRNWMTAPSADPRLLAIHDALDANLYANAHRIGAPTLLVHGTRDPVVSADQSRILSSLLPKASLHLIRGCDHYYSNPKHWMEMFEVSTRHIDEWIH